MSVDPQKPHQFVNEIGRSNCGICGQLPVSIIHLVTPSSPASPGSLPDSGLRESFGEGMAVREADPGKKPLGGISPHLKLAIGELLRKADDKYKAAGGYRNWEKGMPVTRCIDAIERHLTSFQLFDESEDHLAAIAWNAMVLIHYRDGGTTTGLSFAELDDRPKWFKAPK